MKLKIKKQHLSAKNLKCKVIDEEIHDVRKKRKCIQDNIVYMNNEANKISIVVRFYIIKKSK